MSTTSTRDTGSVLRIYKNSSNKVIAIDEISVTTDTRRITIDRFHHSSTWKHKRTLFHLGVGDRVVYKILMLGDYSSITEDGGDYLNATWDGSSANENNAVMNFDALAKVGDTL